MTKKEKSGRKKAFTVKMVTKTFYIPEELVSYITKVVNGIVEPYKVVRK